jgi:hypothetical protein
MKITSLASVAAVLLVAVLVPAARAGILYTDNFQSDTVGQNPANYTITSDTATSNAKVRSEGTNQYLAYRDLETAASPYVVRQFGTALQHGSVEFQMRFVSGTDTNMNVVLFTPGNEQPVNLTWFATNYDVNGPIHFYSGVNQIDPAVSIGVWHTVYVEWDSTVNNGAGEFFTRYDGGAPIFSTYFPQGTYQSISRITFNAAYGDRQFTQVDYDNITVATPEPADLGLLAASAMLVLRRKR